ncbi:MAG: pantetheine-phosphate adenylyltransferase [Caldilineaceae bacterium]|nr:pantetheine-phosphate adenylyltransferase [Caldilineaceae bacterium]MCB9138529.1 pantetheine-phosphate adenylyltransferase [Caldilineaceae bacterium]
MTRALYPGTFDPLHNGHIDIATRACRLFDDLIVAVYDVPPKKLLFSTDERVELAQAALAHLPNVSVTHYAGLTVDCARRHEVDVMVRGLRNVTDFEFEHQIHWANSQLAPDIELCCLFCPTEYAYLSATILKEVASLNGDYARWAPDNVRRALRHKFSYPDPAEPAEKMTRTQSKFTHHG